MESLMAIIKGFMFWGLAMLPIFGCASKANAKPMPGSLVMLNGESMDTSQWKGKAVLFVNVASRCGFTPQYDGLQGLLTKYKDQGLVVVGVPCNQFGSQEPGKGEEIQSFCRINYGVDFPLLDKQDVNGSKQSPLYQYLLAGRTPVLWNFEKVLVGKDGAVIDRFRSATAPDSNKLVTAIEAALK
jgi:glutathione peroxidase